MSLFDNPLLDKDFLLELDSKREREVYARIIALNFQEQPVELIEGLVTQGSINIDGASAVRRTCSLTLVAKDIDINDFYWGVKSKFKLEVGLRNTVDTDRYPEIIWFPQGTYVIASFNTSRAVANCTISISGKDKMCLLNGDLGGNLPASIDFGVEEYYDSKNNITTYTKIPIPKIIREALHTYALEPYHNIILNDLDDLAVELLEYRGDQPLYLLHNVEIDSFVNYTDNGNTEVYFDNDNQKELFPIKELEAKGGYYDSRIEDLGNDIANEPSKLRFNNDPNEEATYTVAKIEYGQTVGYRPTELTYAGDLISNIGEALTSIFDKIKNMLGNYEYFYDIDGRFIFQRKKTYTYNTWNNIVNVGDEEYVDSAAHSSAVSYRFEGNKLISSFQNSPVLSNLKNDYSIWGSRESVSGAKIPIHYRYAIDYKPTVYNTIKDPEDQNAKSVLYTVEEYDWRELIYQMALDYYKYNQRDDYATLLAQANKESGPENTPLYQNGVTGYEQYYIDLQGFWRQLYNPGNEEFNEQGWSKQIQDNPSQLNFWFDFLDAESELGQFSVPAVGDRPKAIKDDGITAIYFRRVPDLVFVSAQQAQDNPLLDGTEGYTKVQMTNNLETMFSISAQGKSAQEALDEQLYNHSYCIENVTIQAIPIYYLQPNTRIFIKDEESKVEGEYIVGRISIPLSYNGMMSITASKAPERIY